MMRHFLTVSETDLLRKEEFQRSPRRAFHVTHRTAHSKAEALTAEQLMTSPAVTVEGGRTLDEAARLMAARGLTRLVVTDGDKLIGIVARSDLLRAFLATDEELLARVRRDVVDRRLWDDPFAVEVSVREGVVPSGRTCVTHQHAQVPALHAQQHARVGRRRALVSDAGPVHGSSW